MSAVRTSETSVKYYTSPYDSGPRKKLLAHSHKLIDLEMHINDRGLFNDDVSSCTLHIVKCQDDK